MSVNRNLNRDPLDYEKDNLITNLRKQIFEMEQNEKNYNTLNSKYRTLQNDFTLACEDKLRQEFEYKQRLDAANKQISELRGDFESVQQTLDERINLNKKLYQDNSALHRLSEDRAQEIIELKSQLSEAKMTNDSLENQRVQLERTLNQTTEELGSQKNFNDRLAEDNEKLSRLLDEQDYALKNLDAEKRKLANRNDELNFETKSLTGKLKSKEESLIQANRKIEDLSKTVSLLENKNAELEAFLEKTKLELGNSRKDHNKEKNHRQDCERTIEKLEGVVREREKDLRNSNVDIENLKLLNNKLNEEKNRGQNENERLKNHILVLTEQNQKYSEEIEAFVEQDEKIKSQLAYRKDNSNNLLKTNRSNLDRSLGTLDNFFNKSNSGEARVTSPTRYATRTKN